MPLSDCEVRDPRMKRTRQLLQGALKKLLQEKSLDEILVQDITDIATINRATFYDHYTDKFKLFEAMVASDFQQLLAERNIRLDGTCSAGLAAIILAVGDYLKEIHSNETACSRQDPFAPLMDSAITLAIQHLVLEGLRKREGKRRIPDEIAASTVSFAVYGAAKGWFYSGQHKPAEEIVSSLAEFILPLLESGGANGHSASTRAKHASKTKTTISR